jgi:hypothetical protein
MQAMEATPKLAGKPLSLGNLDDWARPADGWPWRFPCFHNVGEADTIILGPDRPEPMTHIAPEHERIRGGRPALLLVGDEGREAARLSVNSATVTCRCLFKTSEHTVSRRRLKRDELAPPHVLLILRLKMTAYHIEWVLLCVTAKLGGMSLGQKRT